MTDYELAQEYFSQRQDHFWQWAAADQAVEWTDRDQTTICYLAELRELLLALREQGLPPLAPLLLLLAACNDHWPRHPVGTALLRQLAERQPAADSQSQAHLSDQVNDALRLLHAVRQLPPDLRTGPAKLHLLREVFRAQAPEVTPAQATAVLDIWTSSRLRPYPPDSLPPLTRRRYGQELSSLAAAHARFPTPDELARHLRTGLPEPPAPLPELAQLLESVAGYELTPVIAPAPPLAPAGDLLAQLATEPRTAPLARLTRHLLAGLRLPAPAQGAGELPLGGVADLTNRGTLDQLLLSELAHDDLTFTARLANNEALYWRREEPPRPTPPPPVLLLDTTLRLWGTPRVFGLAAALAWAQLAATARPRRPAALALALGGEQATPLDLRTSAGVVEALALLDPAPHAGAALHALARRPPVPGPVEYVLVTAAEVLALPAFAQALAAAPLPLRYALAVDRDGTLNLYEWVGGHRQLRSSTRYDLAALLAPAAPPKPGRPAPPRPDRPADTPAFWRQPVAPLFLPAVGVRVNGQAAFLHPGLGVLAVTDTYRLLHWPSRHTGAREVLPVIEAGSCYFGTDQTTWLAVLVQAPGQLHVYRLTVATGAVEHADLSALAGGASYQKIGFSDDRFWLWQGHEALMVDCRLATITARHETWTSALRPDPPRPQNQVIRRFLRLNYNVLLRVQQLGVDQVSHFLIGGHQLSAVSSTHLQTDELRLSSYQSHYPLLTRTLSGGAQPSPDNGHVWLRSLTWPDGSTAVLDGRGLLHLRSADPAVPELTLLLVLNQPTAAWAADGTVCGPDYFTGPAPTRRLGGSAFYREYFRPFIQQLVG